MGEGQQTGRVGPSGPVTRFRLDGREVTVATAPDTPVLYPLRNDLGCAGVRFGCGENQCGACFVLVDGAVTPACDTPLWFVEGKAVTTVAGLGPVGDALRDAFVAEQAAQCGYCSSGILVSAAALLVRRPAPTAGEVAEALDANLCRCGAHPRVVRAVLRAAGALS